MLFDLRYDQSVGESGDSGDSGDPALGSFPPPTTNPTDRRLVFECLGSPLSIEHPVSSPEAGGQIFGQEEERSADRKNDKFIEDSWVLSDMSDGYEKLILENQALKENQKSLDERLQGVKKERDDSERPRGQLGKSPG